MNRQDNPDGDDRHLHRIVDAAVAEAEERMRRRIGQALHDDLQQQLYSLRVRIESVRGLLSESGDDVSTVLADVAEHADRTLDVVHRIARTLDRPTADQHDLAVELDLVRDEMRDLHGLGVEIDRAETAPVVAPHITAMLVRCVRELLFNVVKHGGTEHAAVGVSHTGDELIIRVTDDGVGGAGRPESDGSGRGLATIEERVAVLDGTLHFSSVRGRGTTVTLRVPIGDEAAARPD